jgi:hypothetical protein
MVSDGPLSPIGVILHSDDAKVEELLANFALAAQARGVDVGGVFQRDIGEGPVKARMELVDIRCGQTFPISQNLGGGSTSCRVDPTGLAAASHVLRREIERPASLLVVSKFGKLEAEGGGFADEMFDAVAAGIPLLTSLAARFTPQWQAATDNAGEMLEPDMAALWRWWDKVQATWAAA